jgi:hypothetical protein
VVLAGDVAQRLAAHELGIAVGAGPATDTVSLDGERAFEVREEAVRMTLEGGGPWVVDTRRTLRWAQRGGFFLSGLRGGEGDLSRGQMERTQTGAATGESQLRLVAAAEEQV